MTVLDLSEEHEAFRKVVRDFAEARVAPHAAEWDEQSRFPLEVVHEMGEMGLFGLLVAEEWGGSGADFASLCVAIEEMGRVDQGLGITLSAGVGLGINPIYRFGDDEQRSTWLPRLVAGTALGAFGLTEPDAGSDAAATRTSRRRERDEWVLTGSKAFITNSGTPITSVITITARTDEGISAFLVPAGDAGPHRGACLSQARLAQQRHPSPIPRRLPGAGAEPARRRRSGLRNFLSVLDDGRIAIAALALGCARACLEQSLGYAKHRNAFGGPIGRNQAIAFSLVDLSVSVENAGNLVYKAAALKDQGRPVGGAAAMAKLYATEAAVTATRTATQVFGGAGFIEDTPVARFYRDAKILEIGEGTSEIQRLVLARAMGLPVG